MTSNRRNRLLIMFGTALLLVVVGFIATPLAAPPAAGDEPRNVLLTLTPFILIFVGIILAFIALIILLATLLNGNIDPVWYRRVEIGLIGGIIIGVVGMIQPLNVELFKYGFLLLLSCTIGFIVWSHLVPRHASPKEDSFTTVSATELGQREAIGDK